MTATDTSLAVGTSGGEPGPKKKRARVAKPQAEVQEPAEPETSAMDAPSQPDWEEADTLAAAESPLLQVKHPLG